MENKKDDHFLKELKKFKNEMFVGFIICFLGGILLLIIPTKNNIIEGITMLFGSSIVLLAIFIKTKIQIKKYEIFRNTGKY